MGDGSQGVLFDQTSARRISRAVMAVEQSRRSGVYYRQHLAWGDESSAGVPSGIPWYCEPATTPAGYPLPDYYPNNWVKFTVGKVFLDMRELTTTWAGFPKPEAYGAWTYFPWVRVVANTYFWIRVDLLTGSWYFEGSFADPPVWPSYHSGKTLIFPISSVVYDSTAGGVGSVEPLQWGHIFASSCGARNAWQYIETTESEGYTGYILEGNIWIGSVPLALTGTPTGWPYVVHGMGTAVGTWYYWINYSLSTNTATWNAGSSRPTGDENTEAIVIATLYSYPSIGGQQPAGQIQRVQQNQVGDIRLSYL